jgi:hypothetical protein
VTHERCTQCGQPLSHGETLPLLAADGQEGEYWSSEQVVERQPAPYGRWLANGVGVLAVFGIGSWLLTRGGDEVAEEPAITLPEVIEFEDETLEESADVAPDFESADDVTARLAHLGAPFLLSYQSGERVVTIDLRDGQVWDALQSEKLNEPIANFALVPDGARTMGVDFTNPDRVFMITSTSHVVPNETPGIYSVISFDPMGEANGVVVGVVDIAPQLSYYRIPSGSDQLIVPGLGVLVSPPNGGSYLVTRVGFEQVSEGRVLAATPEKRIEIRCDDELECDLVFVDALSEAAVSLPEQLGASRTLQISPDNRYVLSAGRTGTVLYNLMRRDSREIPAGISGQVVWAPDSSFVAWMRVEEGSPTLAVLATEASEPTFIDLAPLMVAEMTGDAFTIFEPQF